MSSPFNAYPAPLHCGLYRAHIKKVPTQLSSVELELSQLRPPFDLIPVHNRSHLVSFANHISSLIEQPVQKVVTDQGNFYCVLGVAVFHKLPNQTFEFAVWVNEPGLAPTLCKAIPFNTPVLDFPRTSLWQELLYRTLQDESRKRIKDELLAEAWAKWAWDEVQKRLIEPLNLRRLRSQIRKGLELNLAAVSMLRRIRSITNEPFPSVTRYNLVQQHLQALTDLWSQSPLLTALASHLLASDALNQNSAKNLRRRCIEEGMKPKQWQLLANPKTPLRQLYAAFTREFAGDNCMHPAVDFVQLISTLKLTKALDIDVWRSILSIAGTRIKPPRSYAKALGFVGDSLAHMIRLIERGACPDNPETRHAQVHMICAWLCDKTVKSISKSQRRTGWRFLHRQGIHHALRRKMLLEYGGAWTVPLHPMKVGAYNVVPITNGGELWYESVAMAHCADLFGEACRSGQVIMVSLRKGNNKRHATLALHRLDGMWQVKQISGKANRRLGSDVDEVGRFLAKLLNLTCPCGDHPLPSPHYVIKVRRNSNYLDQRVDRVCQTSDEAIAAAKEICLASIERQEQLGMIGWLIQGEEPLIEPHCGAPKVYFNAAEFVDLVYESRRTSTSGEPQ